MNDSLFLILLFFAGAAASFINVMAGGGSVLTLGTLLLFGVEPAIANGTNRIGILFGTASGALSFKAEKFTDLKQSLLLGAFAIPGAIFGSFYSIQLDGILFQRIFALVMIFILISMFFPKQNRLIEKTRDSKLIYPAMFLVGLYGGFIQVGVGFILMFFLRHLMALDLIRTNMHKTFVVLIYTIPVLMVFGFSGKINWSYALCMSAGNSLGAWVSVKLAVRKGEKIVKLVLALAIALMTLRFLFAV